MFSFFNRDDELLKAIYSTLRRILHNQGNTMSAIDDLKAAITDLAEEVAIEIKELADALAKPQTPDVSADIEASVANLKDLTAALKASGAPAVVAEPAPVEPPVEPVV